jgi:hypothetical protein
MSPSSTPVLTEREQRPWLYPYRQDVQLGWHGELVLRPLLPVSLANGSRETPRLAGLVASGADLTLVSDVLAEELGIGLEDYEGEGDHLAAGGVVRARYKTIDLRLHSPDADLHSPDDLCLHSTDAAQDAAEDGYRQWRQWRSKIGFVENCWYSDGLVVLGGVGFFDQFEVAIGGPSQAVAITDPPGDYVSAAPGPDFGPED